MGRSWLVDRERSWNLTPDDRALVQPGKRMRSCVSLSSQPETVDLIRSANPENALHLSWGWKSSFHRLPCQSGLAGLPQSKVPNLDRPCLRPPTSPPTSQKKGRDPSLFQQIEEKREAQAVPFQHCFMASITISWPLEAITTSNKKLRTVEAI